MIKFTLSSTGQRVGLIGDPHLGKDFDLHAPAHRKGERRMKQMAQFNEELWTEDVDIIVMVGDLFDHPQVSHSTILLAARAVLNAAEMRPVTFIMMAGNHDMPRNLTTVGAWTTFTKMLEDRIPNLHVLRRPALMHKLALFPWEWDRTSEEQVLDLAGGEADAAIGHWDLELFDGDGSHMAPTATLKDTFGDHLDIYSGHFHTPGLYKVDGIVVTCTGSMQPITHGEDPNEQFYVTLTLDELKATDPAVLHDKHVRVLVKPGEEVPEIDCLAITHKRLAQETEKHEGSFTPDSLDWAQKLSGRIAKLAKPVQDFIIERMPDVDPKKQRRSGSDARSEGARVEDTGDDALQQGSAL